MISLMLLIIIEIGLVLFLTKKLKGSLEILFSARNLLPVNEKTAWGGGLIEG